MEQHVKFIKLKAKNREKNILLEQKKEILQEKWDNVPIFEQKGGSSGRREFENWNLSTVLRQLHFAIEVLREGGR